jgi:hypothetical protein
MYNKLRLSQSCITSILSETWQTRLYLWLNLPTLEATLFNMSFLRPNLHWSAGEGYLLMFIALFCVVPKEDRQHLSESFSISEFILSRNNSRWRRKDISIFIQTWYLFVLRILSNYWTYFTRKACYNYIIWSFMRWISHLLWNPKFHCRFKEQVTGTKS